MNNAATDPNTRREFDILERKRLEGLARHTAQMFRTKIRALDIRIAAASGIARHPAPGEPGGQADHAAGTSPTVDGFLNSAKYTDHEAAHVANETTPTEQNRT